MRLLLAGDFHGDSNHMGYIYQMAENQKADAIFQLGDFGFWPRAGRQAYLETRTKLFKKHGIPLYWIDGNHEDHDTIDFNGWQTPGFHEFQPGLTFVGRGTRWEWDGTKFLAMGGAYSIDENYRTQGFDWFPQEVISYSQAMQAIGDGDPVDIMLTHDAPKFPYVLQRDADEIGYKQDIKSAGNRRMVKEIVDAVRPQMLVHGHFHADYGDWYPFDEDIDGPGMTIVGLGMNGDQKKSWAHLDLPLKGEDE